MSLNSPEIIATQIPPTVARQTAPRSGQTGNHVLPEPPDDKEKYSYVRRHLWVLTTASLISMSCLVYSQFRLLHASLWLIVLLPCLGFTVLYYVTSMRVNAFTADFDLKAHRRLVQDWRPKTHPTVAVFLPVCGEPTEVLENTWTHVRRLADRYPGKATAYVLDDSANPELAALAERFGFVYGSRPNRGWFKKAGNLHYGLGISHEEYILILDADFAPRADLLEELLPYMEHDPEVGIVQSPQYFRVLGRQTWIERGAGSVQELFYRVVQVSRQRHGGAICVGSCAVYRRKALEANGGTTLIEHSEDVHTGFDLRRLGWGLRYVPIPLATGNCPDNVSAFYHQQYRWCAGSMSLLGSRKFWDTKLRLTTRLCYVSGFFYYLHTALFTFVAPLIPIVLLVAMPEKLKAENALLVLPSVVYTVLLFPCWHRCRYRLEAWAVRLLYGWAHLFAIWDIVRGRRQSWRPTGSAAAGRSTNRRFWIGVWVWNGGTAVVWLCAAIWRTVTLYPLDFCMVLASGLFYALIVGRVLVPPRTTTEARVPVIAPRKLMEPAKSVRGV
ncbi:glycosyltransferase family 2 protein [Streptomyces sp. NPDC085866]|uniref:glycosyltransferase family 2 protein n=1 Tax=Streptomyces sp. NPDC085866 TaxID=3365736 RepID=UPI0037D5D3A8